LEYIYSIIKRLLLWILLILSGMLGGFLFHICYGFSNKLLWSRNLSRLIQHLLTWINPRTEFQHFIFFVSLNIVVAFTSSLLGSVLFGLLLVRLFRDRAMLYGLGYSCIYLLLTFPYRRLVNAPDLSLQVSVLIMPIVASLTLLLSILIIRKYSFLSLLCGNEKKTGSHLDIGHLKDGVKNRDTSHFP
jgi:hypothetical protein